MPFVTGFDFLGSELRLGGDEIDFGRQRAVGQGIEQAREAIASGAARAKLDAFARFTQACAA